MRQKLMRKVSIILLFSVMASMLMPIISYAASVMYFVYRPVSGDVYFKDPELTGYVYTRDPDSAKVNLNTGSGTQAATGKIGGVLYDDNNTPYYIVEYTAYAGQAPSSISVDVEGSTYSLTGVPHSKYPDVYRYMSSLTADLTTYRMPGQLHIPTVTGATYLPAGSDIVSFTPDYNGNTSGEGIIIRLPYNSTTNTTFNSEAMDITGGDFEIIDQTVSSSVYYSGYTYDSRGELTFNLNTDLIEGHQYLVKLSSTSSGNEIFLPVDGVYTASVKIGYWGSGYPPYPGQYFDEANSLYFRNLVIGNSGTLPPTDPVNPPTDPGTGPSPSLPTEPGKQPNKDRVVVNEESLRNGTKDKVAVDIANGTKQVLLPVNAAKVIGDRQLELSNDQLSVSIPSEVLTELRSFMTDQQLDGAQIKFTLDTVNPEETTALLNKAKSKSKSELKAAGEIYDFKLSVVSADGKEKVLDQFKKAITLRLKVREDAKPALLGVYYIADDGSLEYVGGQLTDGVIAADVTHFSKYAVLEYDKTFTDVSDQFWAFNAIKELSAKHIINGVNESEFAPKKQMTRAELTSLIARTLNLKASQAASFADVNSSSVHADEIAAASEAGIVRGQSAENFAPDQFVTREEMVIMITRAYEYKSGKKVVSETESSYTDRILAAEWARPSIDAASSIGIVVGYDNETFAPKNLMTRAEGALLAYRLLKSE